MTTGTMLKVFKSTIPSVNYLFKNGKPAIFVAGRYTTKVAHEVTELEEEIASGHPHLYVDKAELQIDEKHLDPMAALRDKIIADYLATEAAKDPLQDMGTSKQGSILPANSNDVAAATAGGSGLPLAARLLKVSAPNSAKLV